MTSTPGTAAPLPPPPPDATPEPTPIGGLDLSVTGGPPDSSLDASSDAAVPGDRGRGLGYLPGLDGLRAVAVAAVFAFHAGVLDGGFLGVDVFFVISGFLITGLAVQEIESEGRLRLGAFWARRARRLLPAVIALCAAVVAWSFTGGRRTDSLDGEVTSTLLYVANWHRLRSGYEYFAAYDEPSLLEHTWSLAVEEQFYVVWPLVIIGVAWLAALSGRGRVRYWIAAAAGVALAASVGWAWLLASDETIPVNRLYFGTDTRGVGLAIGCIAGCLLTRGVRTGEGRVATWLTSLGLAGAVVLGVAMVIVDGGERWLYGPGFAALGLCSLAVLLAATRAGPIAAALSLRPLVAIGRVSYGIYLWHWPVIVVLDSDRTGLDGPTLGALWIAVTALLTWVSWVFIERRAPLPRIDRPVRAAAYAMAMVLVGGAAVVAADDGAGGSSDVPLALPSTEATDDAGAADSEQTAAGDVEADPGRTEPEAVERTGRDRGSRPETPRVRTDPEPGTAGAADSETERSVEADPETDPATEFEVEPVPLPPDRPLRVLLLGDSVAESLGDPIATPMQIGRALVSVTNRSVIACPVTFEGRWAFDDGRLIADPAECDSPDRFAADVSENDPDVVVLMFGWGGTIAGRELDSGEVVDPCEPGFDDRYAAAYADLAGRMAVDARVVVTTVAPPTEYRDPSQADRPGCLNAQIESLGYDVFDFGDWLCPDSDCTSALPLMRDTVHFSNAPEVRDLVWPALAEEFVTAAGYDVEPRS
ncbi:MAG: acyltransferase [Actinomycetota bacterium]